jgi:hypothetical protein
MEIQRVKFLLLASALAGPACVTTVTDENPGNDGAAGASSSTGGKKATGGSSATGGKTATGGASATGGATTGSGGSNGGADGSAGGTDGSTAGAGGTDGGKADGSKPGDGAVTIDANRPDGNTCSDDTIEGGFGNCDLLQADACSIADFQVGKCNGTQESMKPFIAQLAIECILSNRADCDAGKTYQCEQQALNVACPDATADDECGTIHTACSAITVDDCKLYLNGMTQTGRDRMVTCLQASCADGLYSCMEGNI